MKPRSISNQLNPLLQAGVGGLFGNSEHLSWRFAYSFMPGEKITLRRLKGNTFNDFPNTNYSSSKPTQHQVSCGFIYRT